jgi:glycosyltransferase involved in cell wall biosynthesis
MDQKVKAKAGMKITMVVTSDLATDQRVQRHAELLVSKGYRLTLIGRKREKSLPFTPVGYKAIRLESIVENGWLFYVSYNIKLLCYLLLRPSAVIWSNDLDTLLPSYIASRLKSNALIYDTHEYYTGVPELQDRPFIRSLWVRLEKWLLPKVKFGLTVSESVAQRYKTEYGIVLTTIRNIPLLSSKEASVQKSHYALPDVPFIIYQGALNKDRGLEELITAMQWVKNYSLVIVGRGDLEESLNQLVKELNLSDRVVFLGLLAPTDLKTITPHAVAGVSIEKPTNPNYIMCLPNKLFDYVQAGIPIVAFPHPEIKNIIDTYQCGAYIHSHDPQRLAAELKEILDSPAMQQWKEASKKASLVLNWEKEKEILSAWLEQVLVARK